MASGWGWAGGEERLWGQGEGPAVVEHQGKAFGLPLGSSRHQGAVGRGGGAWSDVHFRKNILAALGVLEAGILGFGSNSATC